MAVASRVARDDPDEEVQARLVRTLLLTFVALTLSIALIGVWVRRYDRAAISAAGGAVYLLLLALLPRLGPRRTGYLCTLWHFTLATGAMASGLGIHDITLVLFPAGLLMGALLLDSDHLVPLVALSIAAVVGVGVLSISRGVSERPIRTDVADIVVVALLLLVSGVLARLVVTSLQARVAQRRRAEEEALAAKTELEARNEALLLVNGLTQRLQRKLDVDAIAGETVDVLIRHSHPPLVAFYLLDDEGKSLHLVAHHGFTENELSLGAVLPLQGSLSGISVREQRIVFFEDVGHDARVVHPVGAALSGRGIASGLCIPLSHGESAFGTVNLIFRGRREVGDLEAEAYEGIARAVSLALANARLVAGLEYQTVHDSLTALPNRPALHRRLRVLLAGSSGDRRVGLVLLDLNRFREINDALGHHVGDELLRGIGARLREGSERGRSEIFRLGGDEFAILLPGVDGVEGAVAGARRLLASLERPFEVAGMGLEVGAGAGVAVFPEHGRDSHELLRCADVALYRAKQSPEGVAVYARELDEHTPDRLALLSELGRAVREGQLLLHFQPKVALQYGFIEGYEALVRWRHPRQGLLASGQFVPFAEASDVVHPLTYWVVENALAQLKVWNRQLPRLTMAINLSVRNLLDRGCPERLEEIMRRVGVDPALVEFELTETAIMTDPEAAVTALGRITATGARLAVDDFGTGYSSLAYLKRLPVDVLKIDRSFITDMASGARSLAIVRSTVHLAHSLDLGVVAEGVEDQQSVTTLRDLGCDLAQGYFLARPAPAEDAARFLERGGWFPIPA